ncbi:hypothetical protein RIF29_28079 [Crotalaria pallida]|uniref:RecA family profile 1 domain-containing protein n=1 Tax=Crotalaria pallida TaxID=3830 RepID=A0AAN9I307_CROPI
MRILRTIFTLRNHHHLPNHHLFTPKSISLHSFTPSHSPHLQQPQTQTNDTVTNNITTPPPTSTTSNGGGWSSYTHVFETPSRGASSSSSKRKEKLQWLCSNCGHSTSKWWGTCPSCAITGTMKEFLEAKSSNIGDNGDGSKVKSGLLISEDAVGLWLPRNAAQLRPLKLEEVNRGFNYQRWRIPLSGSFGNEVSTVLGGGLVPGSLTLISGDPGVGKSTLVLQVAGLIAEGCNDGKASPVVYVSGEESLEQIGSRADRLGIKSDVYLYSSTDIEDILKKAQCVNPRALVVDSIQTVYLKGILGSAGGLVQVKECTSALMRFAKTTNIPVFLIGHVTKSGDIAGPRVLEHIVDVVLYLEGEKESSYRMLRAVKNRFGSADELGVFEMSQSGLKSVSNASEIFLSEQHSDSEFLAGIAVAVVMDGSRTFLIEIQALCLSPSPVPASSSNLVNGIGPVRANMIKCVLIKQAGLQLQENAVFLNVVSGLTIQETAGDLAVAAAICSSFLELPIPKGIAFIGEIGLGGELRMVPRMEKRVYTVAKLGYTMCVVPKQAEKVLEAEGLGKMTVVGCKNLKEVINTIFRST